MKYAIAIFTCMLFLYRADAQLQNMVKLQQVVFQHVGPKGSGRQALLSIDSLKQISLNRTANSQPNKIDTAKTGYFIGKLNDQQFCKLISLLSSSNLDTVNNKTVSSAETMITITVYFDNQKKQLAAPLRKHKSIKLIKFLNHVAFEMSLIKKEELLNIE